MAALLQRERTMSNEMHFYLHSIRHKAAQPGAECYSWYFLEGWGLGCHFVPVFTTIVSIVILNLLISLLGDTFDRVQQRRHQIIACERAALFAALDPTFFFLNIAAAVRGFREYFSFPFQH
jgi:hypothetical protein